MHSTRYIFVQFSIFCHMKLQEVKLKELSKQFKLTPSKQYKNSKNLQFMEQNMISFCPSLCLLQFVSPSTLLTADGFFQFLNTVICKTLKLASHGILDYQRSVDLPKIFSHLAMSIFTFLNQQLIFFLNIFSIN